MSDKVAEIQGWYGPLALSERLIQMLWAEQEWLRGPQKLWDGRSLRVLSAGEWNHGAGPDFHRARMIIDGERVCGDVEIHLYPEDWRRHGHERDPAFNEVRLHACVFPPSGASLVCRTAAGSELPLWVMSPYLPEDLEHLVDHFREVDRRGWEKSLKESVLNKGPDWVLERLWEGARHRFEAKVSFADWLIRRDGWHQGCHEWMLGHLGIPQNRAAMLSCAQKFTWQEMAREGFSIDAAMQAYDGTWKNHGLRPANQPARRLRQYRSLLRTHPQWMDGWQDFSWTLPPGSDRGVCLDPAFRRSRRLKDLRNWIFRDLWCGIWTGPRFDSLVVDVLIPMHQARHSGANWFPVWFNWWAGDWPERFSQVLRDMPIPTPRGRNGYCQGLFEWRLQWQMDQGDRQGTREIRTGRHENA